MDKTRTKLVAVKLTPTELVAAKQLCRDREYRTLSGVLRAGLMMVCEKHGIKLDALVQIRIERCRHVMRRSPKYGKD